MKGVSVQKINLGFDGPFLVSEIGLYDGKYLHLRDVCKAFGHHYDEKRRGQEWVLYSDLVPLLKTMGIRDSRIMQFLNRLSVPCVSRKRKERETLIYSN